MPAACNICHQTTTVETFTPISVLSRPVNDTAAGSTPHVDTATIPRTSTDHLPRPLRMGSHYPAAPLSKDTSWTARLAPPDVFLAPGSVPAATSTTVVPPSMATNGSEVAAAGATLAQAESEVLPAWLRGVRWLRALLAPPMSEATIGHGRVHDLYMQTLNQINYVTLQFRDPKLEAEYSVRARAKGRVSL